MWIQKISIFSKSIFLLLNVKRNIYEINNFKYNYTCKWFEKIKSFLWNASWKELRKRWILSIYFINDENVFLGKKGFGFRLYKPKPDLHILKNIQSRRSFITILEDNIDNIRFNLD